MAGEAQFGLMRAVARANKHSVKGVVSTTKQPGIATAARTTDRLRGIANARAHGGKALAKGQGNKRRDSNGKFA